MLLHGVYTTLLLFNIHVLRIIMGRHLNIVSWNVKGLNHPVKRKKVLTHLKQLNTDIAFLHETHLRSPDNSRFLAGWAGQHVHSTFQVKVRGVSILLGFIIVVGKLFNTKVVFANVYAPNIDDVCFFNRLFSHFPDLGSHYLILGGHFNCWFHQTWCSE